MIDVLLSEQRPDLLQNSYEVAELKEQTVSSKASSQSSMDRGLVYPDYQDCDDDAASAATTASFRSDYSFYSDLSQGSGPPSPSTSSALPSTDGSPKSNSGDEEGAVSAVDWSPQRQSRHRRTRSGNWNSDVLETMPTQSASEESGAESPSSAAGKSGQSCMQAAYFSFWGAKFPTMPSSLRRTQTSRYGAPISLPPLAEVEPIEEEDEEEVPTEPAPMVPKSFCSDMS